METNQVSKTGQPTSVVVYKPNLKAELQRGDKQAVQLILRDFKTPNGAANFPVLFSIPTENRLAKMAENDFTETLSLVTAGVTLAMEALNLRTPMNPLQILDLSEAIIDTASDDNLSLEDLMLFLQNLTRGKYNPLYESMDVSKFMEKFEIYREQRHRAILEYRENKHLEFKALGNADRSGTQASPLDTHLSEYSTKLQSIKDELHEQKRENKALRQQK